MKYLCSACERLVEVTRFALDNGQLVLFCARCGADTRAAESETLAVHAEAPSAPGRVVPLHPIPPPTFSGEDPFAIPPGHCVKCVAPRPEPGMPCRSCGLVAETADLLGLDPSPELRAIWTELIRQWDDLKAHDAAVAQVSARAELAAMGRLYRIRLARQPMDPIALRGRDEVVRVASSASAAIAESSPPPRRSQALILGGVICVAVVLVVLLQMLFSGPVVE